MSGSGASTLSPNLFDDDDEEDVLDETRPPSTAAIGTPTRTRTIANVFSPINNNSPKSTNQHHRLLAQNKELEEQLQQKDSKIAELEDALRVAEKALKDVNKQGAKKESDDETLDAKKEADAEKLADLFPLKAANEEEAKEKLDFIYELHQNEANMQLLAKGLDAEKSDDCTIYTKNVIQSCFFNKRKMNSWVLGNVLPSDRITVGEVNLPAVDVVGLFVWKILKINIPDSGIYLEMLAEIKKEWKRAQDNNPDKKNPDKKKPDKKKPNKNKSKSDQK